MEEGRFVHCSVWNLSCLHEQQAVNGFFFLSNGEIPDKVVLLLKYARTEDTEGYRFRRRRKTWLLVAASYVTWT